MAKIKVAPSVVLHKNSAWKSRVIEMQNGLLDLGYDIGEDGADGDYGENTLAAVIKFQSEHSLDADGEFGPQSWTAMYEALGYTVSNPSYPTATVIKEDSSQVYTDGSLLETVTTQNFSEGDKVKILNNAVYLSGQKVPEWIKKKILYVRNINSSGSISISLFRNGLIMGIISPIYLELIENAVENQNTTTVINTIVENNSKEDFSSRTYTDLIKIANNEVGYYEKSSNSNLDDKSANAGGNNFTKYARDLAAAGYYNGDKNGYAWCDVFVDWCFYQLCNKNRTEAEDMTCQTGDGGAGCSYSASYYKSQNRFDNNPKVGDQIFFYYSGDINHTGIVTAIEGTTIATVEGNSSDQVSRRTYPIGYSSIAGYGHPKYSNSNDESETLTSARVKVTANKLNVRSKPNDTSSIVSVVSKGSVFTIVDQEGVYGRISTGEGWIDLSYTQKI